MTPRKIKFLSEKQLKEVRYSVANILEKKLYYKICTVCGNKMSKYKNKYCSYYCRINAKKHL